jgi:hypothetical protein
MRLSSSLLRYRKSFWIVRFRIILHNLTARTLVARHRRFPDYCICLWIVCVWKFKNCVYEKEQKKLLYICGNFWAITSFFMSSVRTPSTSFHGGKSANRDWGCLISLSFVRVNSHPETKWRIRPRRKDGDDCLVTRYMKSTIVLYVEWRVLWTMEGFLRRIIFVSFLKLKFFRNDKWLFSNIPS